ncbi:MAG TPA: hypothetical protein DCR26_07620 [Porphyromonadaceae bacterium]|nr:hypothetical protein [Porphyromonadaceae bacterium]
MDYGMVGLDLLLLQKYEKLINLFVCNLCFIITNRLYAAILNKKGERIMLWTAIGCFIAGVVVMISMFIWQGKAIKKHEEWGVFNRWRMLMMVAYLLLFIASAVLFLLC